MKKNNNNIFLKKKKMKTVKILMSKYHNYGNMIIHFWRMFKGLLIFLSTHSMHWKIQDMQNKSIPIISLGIMVLQSHAFVQWSARFRCSHFTMQNKNTRQKKTEGMLSGIVSVLKPKGLTSMNVVRVKQKTNLCWDRSFNWVFTTDGNFIPQLLIGFLESFSFP